MFPYLFNYLAQWCLILLCNVLDNREAEKHISATKGILEFYPILKVCEFVDTLTSRPLKKKLCFKGSQA